jgi:hypothetical protein
MNTKQKHMRLASQRSSERGAALLTTLLVSTLLLAAGSALIVSTSLSTTTEIDATAEMQAYAAAEAGLESTLNVLRGNVAPDASLSGTKISFLTAVTPATSNKVGDNSGLPRLSGWLPYSSSYTDRVAITANYAPQNGFAYKISVRDPDNKPAGTAPSILVISSTGYGPKGASKVLELVVKAGSFDFAAPATITVRGADDGSATSFALGDSNKKVYSGTDYANPGATPLPAFAVTNADTRRAANSIAGGVQALNPPLGVLPIDISINSAATGANAPPSSPVNPAPPSVSTVPAFLQSPDTTRALVNSLKATAQATNRYFTSWNGASGTTAAPVFTFIDGNATITGGGGLVVCTGNLLLHENSGFNGLILVLGNGVMTREGGGPSTFRGAVVVARLDLTHSGQPFLAPTYSTQPDQGNVVTMQYDSSAVQSALNLSGLSVVHVVEK